MEDINPYSHSDLILDFSDDIIVQGLRNGMKTEGW